MAAKKKAKRAAKKAARKAVRQVKRAAARKPAVKKPAHPQVVHWEVQAADPAKQQAFYGSLFGWKIDANNPMSYGMVTSGGPDGIDGGIGGTMGGGARLTVYVQVKSIDDALAKAATLGATTVMPRTDVGPVIIGQFADPEGVVVGLIEG